MQIRVEAYKEHHDRGKGSRKWVAGVYGKAFHCLHFHIPPPESTHINCKYADAKSFSFSIYFFYSKLLLLVYEKFLYMP